MPLELFEKSNSSQWDEIIRGAENGTLYHSWDWLKIIEKYSGSKLYPLVYFDSEDKKPFGAIPLFYMNKYGMKMVFSPPPGSSITLGPVLIEKGYKQHKRELAYLDFQASIDQFIAKLGARYIGITTSPGLLDIRPFLWSQYKVIPLYTYKIDLSPGKEIVCGAISQKVKQNVRNAEKRGIIVTESNDSESVEHIIYSLMRTFGKQQLKSPVQKGYLQELFEKFRQTGLKIYLANYEGKVIGSLMCSVYKETLVTWVGGSRNDSNNLEANELLTLYTLNKAIDEGFSWYELMGANTRRLCDFKSRFCPQPSLYFQINKAGFLGKMAEKTYILIQKQNISIILRNMGINLKHNPETNPV
jgi:lipid II:glycine glycyltransferase (peptidoglycan interpeptide bridge formation enzyme)